MDYKIIYLEDLEPDSIEREIEKQGLNVIHIQPVTSFEDTLNQIKAHKPNLLLMDFRLNAGVGRFNAPPFAQFFRSQVVEEHGKSLPIVLISSEKEIRTYYRDYTSFDLFDFAVEKETFTKKISKYCTLLKELIDSYELLESEQITQLESAIRLLNVPEKLKLRLDKRLLDILAMDKYQNDPFMMSGLLLSSFVKPIGMLIGPDVLSARLGISIDSPDWNQLIDELVEFKYSGLYSKTYERWWSYGIEMWWNENFSNESTLRRLSASERNKLISEKFALKLNSIEKPQFTNSNRYWTICSGNLTPLDPIDGFEIIKDTDTPPWVEPKYYSLNYLINHTDLSILKKLKDSERKRFIEKVKD